MKELKIVGEAVSDPRNKRKRLLWVNSQLLGLYEKSPHGVTATNGQSRIETTQKDLSEIRDDLSDIRGVSKRPPDLSTVITMTVKFQSRVDAVWSHMIFVFRHFTNIRRRVFPRTSFSGAQ